MSDTVHTEIRVVMNRMRCNSLSSEGHSLPDYMATQASLSAQAFHKSFPNYQPTALVSLPGLASQCGIHQLYVKDESHRFGLNAFKVLGASYAMARYICERLGRPIEEVDFEWLRSAEVRRQLGEITFITATDGNHGRAVAWAASQLGQKAVVLLPKGTAGQRVEAIRNTGATAQVINGNYDEAVRLSNQMAEEHGWQVIQDTAWEGYTKIPQWIMQGYTTMAAEAIEQLAVQAPSCKPTHLFLQAGVGSMAAAVLGHFIQADRAHDLFTVIVEPDAANCMYLSAVAEDGKAHVAAGDLQTIMAGLACGEPNPLAWDILRDYADAFVSCPDYMAANGMRLLATPVAGDAEVVSGESGAIGVGLLAALMQKEELVHLRRQLKLDDQSVVLCFSTEGDTDRETYEQIVMHGAYSDKSAPAQVKGEVEE